MENKNEYFLFGEAACNKYHDGENLDYSNDWYAIHIHKPHHTASNILLAYDGWNGFAKINRVQYLRIKREAPLFK